MDGDNTLVDVLRDGSLTRIDASCGRENNREVDAAINFMEQVFAKTDKK